VHDVPEIGIGEVTPRVKQVETGISKSRSPAPPKSNPVSPFLSDGQMRVQLRICVSQGRLTSHRLQQLSGRKLPPA